jgi:hypothetical protein
MSLENPPVSAPVRADPPGEFNEQLAAYQTSGVTLFTHHPPRLRAAVSSCSGSEHLVGEFACPVRRLFAVHLDVHLRERIHRPVAFRRLHDQVAPH